MGIYASDLRELIIKPYLLGLGSIQSLLKTYWSVPPPKSLYWVCIVFAHKPKD